MVDNLGTGHKEANGRYVGRWQNQADGDHTAPGQPLFGERGLCFFATAGATQQNCPMFGDDDGRFGRLKDLSSRVGGCRSGWLGWLGWLKEYGNASKQRENAQ